MELLRRIFAEVVPLDIKLTAERHLAAAFHAAVLTERHVEPFHLPFRIVLDDDLDRIEYGHRARSDRVQVFAHAELEQAVFHQIFRAGHADARTEVTDGFRGVSPASHPANGGHTGIVPAAHEPALHELDELALGQHGVGQAKAGELDLLRVVHVQRVEHPVVQLAVVDELQRADGVRNAFQRVGQAVRKVVHGIDAPLVAGPVVFGMADAVQRGVTHDHIGRGHVDLGAEHMLPVGELAAAHPAEQTEVFLYPTVPVWAFRARLRQRAPAGADFLSALAVHIRLAVTDELLGERIQLIEVVGSVIFPIVPFAAEPVHVFTDGIHVFGIFLHRIGIVEAQVAQPAVLLRQPEVDADGFGVADVQIAVRLRREPGVDFPAEAPGGVVLIDADVQKIQSDAVFRCGGSRFRGGSIHVHEQSFAAAFRGRLAFMKPRGSV